MLSALSSVVAIGAVVTVGGPLAVVLVGTAFALTTLALTIPDDVLLQSGISREELNHAVDTAYAALQKAKQVAPEVFPEAVGATNDMYDNVVSWAGAVDRQSVVEGTMVSVRVSLGGGCHHKKKRHKKCN